MKIAVLSDVDSHGGAALIANGLAERWSVEGHQVLRRYIVRRAGDPRPDFAIPRGRVANHLIHEVGKSYLPAMFRAVSRAMISREIQAFNPDVISLHNLHAADETHDLVESLSGLASVFWTLHDMWSFTGRCAYSGTCEKYLSSCDESCPTPNVRPSLAPELIPREWSRKSRILEAATNLTAVSPSEWLAQKASAGMWSGLPVRVINNGIDLALFRPLSSESAREVLGIPKNARVVAAYVAHPRDPFKTPENLEIAFSAVTSPLHVITFGPGALHLPPRHRQFNFGTVSNRHLLAILYAAADCFVLPSLQENFPTVLLESIACGTPCVAFNVGGIPEILEGVGVVCDSADGGQALALGIERLLQQDVSAIEHLRRYCREIAQIKFDVARQSRVYLELFGDSLIKARQPCSP